MPKRKGRSVLRPLGSGASQSVQGARAGAALCTAARFQGRVRRVLGTLRLHKLTHTHRHRDTETRILSLENQNQTCYRKTTTAWMVGQYMRFAWLPASVALLLQGVDPGFCMDDVRCDVEHLLVQSRTTCGS